MTRKQSLPLLALDIVLALFISEFFVNSNIGLYLCKISYIRCFISPNSEISVITYGQPIMLASILSAIGIVILVNRLYEKIISIRLDKDLLVDFKDKKFSILLDVLIILLVFSFYHTLKPLSDYWNLLLYSFKIKSYSSIQYLINFIMTLLTVPSFILVKNKLFIFYYKRKINKKLERMIL